MYKKSVKEAHGVAKVDPVQVGSLHFRALRHKGFSQVSPLIPRGRSIKDRGKFVPTYLMSRIPSFSVPRLIE